MFQKRNVLLRSNALHDDSYYAKSNQIIQKQVSVSVKKKSHECTSLAWVVSSGGNQAVGLLFHVFHIIQAHANCPMSKTQYSLDKPTIATSSFFKGYSIYDHIYIYTYILWCSWKNNAHVSFTQWFDVESSFEKTMVSSNPRLGRDQGPDIIAKRLLLLDGYLEDAAKSFRELREVQVLHILARERGADAPNLLFHRTKETAIGIAVGNATAKQKTWNLNRSRVGILFATGSALKGHSSSQFWCYFAQSACIIIQLFSFWVTLASFFPSLDPSCPIGIGCLPSSRILDLVFPKVHVWESTFEQLNIFAEVSLRAVILKAKWHNQMWYRPEVDIAINLCFVPFTMHRPNHPGPLKESGCSHKPDWWIMVMKLFWSSCWDLVWQNLCFCTFAFVLVEI